MTVEGLRREDGFGTVGRLTSAPVWSWSGPWPMRSESSLVGGPGLFDIVGVDENLNASDVVAF